MADDNEGETKYCTNCKRDIAAENFLMHEIHCRRNITLCKHCQEPVPKSELDDHFEEYHIKVQCEKCKVSIEKSHLEDHKSECSKRIVTCSYCELELPFDELKPHQEYCGTRTELCPKCMQYIMQRELIKHEESNCKYPIPQKPNNNTSTNAMSSSSSSSSAAGGYQNMFDDEYAMYNGFAMDEISRLMQHSMLDSQASAASSATNQPQVMRNFSSRKTKRTNETRSRGGRRTNTRSRDVNDLSNHDVDSRKKDRNESIDEILAHSLAQDLAESKAQEDYHRLDDDVSTLPCEFCDELFPMDVLIQHQGSCQLSMEPMTSPHSPMISPPHSPSPVRQRQWADQTPNNQRTTTSSPTSQPPVLDNLRELQQSISGPIPDEFLTYDDIMLPCEFCGEQFPMEFLIQHQSVCNDSGIASSAENNSNLQQQETQAASHINHAWTTSPVPARRRNISRKHQAAPDFSESNAEEYGAAASSRGKFSNTTGINNTQSRKNTNKALNGHISSKNASQQYGVNGLVKQLNKPRGGTSMNSKRTGNQYARYQTHGDWSGAAEGEDEKGEDLEEEDRPTSRRKGSAARVQGTLDRLRQDPTYTEFDVTEHLDKNAKMKHNANTQKVNAAGASSTNRRRQRWTDEEDDMYQASFASAQKPVIRRGKNKSISAENLEWEGTSAPMRVERSTPGKRGKKSGRRPNNGSRRPPQGNV